MTTENKTMLDNVANYDILTFTSAQGVRYFFEALNAARKDVRAIGNVKVCAIGAATAKALKDKGILVDILPANYQGESVVKAITAWASDNHLSTARILLVQPKVARKVIPEGLRAAGLAVDILRLYETVQTDAEVAPLIEALALGSVDYLTFTSSSTVTNTIRMLGEEAVDLLGNTKVVCIGPITAATCVEHNIQPALIGETFTIPAMVELIKTDVTQD